VEKFGGAVSLRDPDGLTFRVLCAQMQLVKTWFLLPAVVVFSSCVPLSEVHEHPHHSHHTNKALENLSGLLVGIWSFQQVDPDVSPVVVHFQADATYALETEAAIFEKGRWTVQGKTLRLAPSKGKASVATIEVKSGNELMWTSDGKAPLRMTRI
jgi:hypothetical protein